MIVILWEINTKPKVTYFNHVFLFVVFDDYLRVTIRGKQYHTCQANIQFSITQSTSNGSQDKQE